MSPEQHSLVLELITGRLSDDEFLRRVGDDFEGPLELLRDAFARRDPDDVESALTLAFHFEALTSDDVPLLCDLLLAPWHTRHEDVAIALEDLRDPRSVAAFYQAALNASTYRYLEYDEGQALARKCTWGLAKVATPEARDKLEALSRCGVEAIEAYARKRLS